MENQNYPTTCCLTGVAATPPTPDNENLRLLPDWMTPAEFMQWLMQEKGRMRAELAVDFRLRSDPQHRQDWDILIAMERCTRFHCYGER